MPGPLKSQRARGWCAAPDKWARAHSLRSEKTALKFAHLDDFLAAVARRDPHQPEFLQAVREVMVSLWPFIETHPQ